MKRFAAILSIVSLTLPFTQFVKAADGIWTFNSNGTAANWSLTTNWSGGIIADGNGSKADFSTINITGARNPNIDTTSRTVGRIDIGDTDNTHSYTISASGGASLIFDNTANSANAQLNETATSHGDTISAPIVLNSSLDVTNPTANTLTLSGAISAGTAGTKTIAISSGSVTMSSATINDGSGAVALTYNSSGTLALGSAASNYSGGTTLSGGGKITLGGSGTPLGSGSLTLSGGTLATSASRSTTATNVILTADSALTTTSNSAVNLPFSGTLTGTGGTLTIRNDGAATTALFDVRFSGGDYTMSRPIVVDNGAGGGSSRLSDFNASGTAHTYNGVISGNGSYNRSVSSGLGGTTIFTAANTYTGTTTVNAGVLQLGNGGTTGSLSTASAITMNTAGTLAINRSNAVTQGTDFGSLAGAGKFSQAGSGATTLNTSNT
jgi:autotransporter-associated beta strand protein